MYSHDDFNNTDSVSVLESTIRLSAEAKEKDNV